jgi:hypothetical protein
MLSRIGFVILTAISMAAFALFACISYGAVLYKEQVWDS